MLYGFHTENSWGQPATIVCASESKEDFFSWVKENFLPQKAAEPGVHFSGCRPISFREKLQDKRYRDFPNSIYEFSHISNEQRDRFGRSHGLSIVSNDRCRELHREMLSPPTDPDYHRDDQRTIGEMIGQQSPAVQEIPDQESSKEKFPIGVVDIRVAENKIEVNSIYRGQNAHPAVPDHVLEADEGTLRNQYPHVELPPHDFSLETLQTLAKEIVTATGWYHFPRRNLAVFQFVGDHQKFLYRFKRHQASAFAASPTEYLNLDTYVSSVPRDSLPPVLRSIFEPVEDVECYLYPETSLVGGCFIVPADQVLQMINCAHVRQVQMEGRTLSIFGIIDMDNAVWAVVQLDGSNRLIGIHRYAALS